MKAVCSSEKFVSTYKPKWRYNPEDQHRYVKPLVKVSFEIININRNITKVKECSKLAWPSPNGKPIFMF
jgi:hypothetical protein